MKQIPVGVSNRHVHLTKAHADILFWKDYQFTALKNLSQPWQYACQETVTLVWPKWKISKVRILWPERPQTQVEVSMGDTFVLGQPTSIRWSWDLVWSAPIIIQWPEWEVALPEWLIIAKRHIHMSPADAIALGVTQKQIVSVRVGNAERSLIFDNVIVRVSKESFLDMHIDVEEANAAGVKNGDIGELLA